MAIGAVVCPAGAKELARPAPSGGATGTGNAIAGAEVGAKAAKSKELSKVIQPSDAGAVEGV